MSNEMDSTKPKWINHLHKNLITSKNVDAVYFTVKGPMQGNMKTNLAQGLRFVTVKFLLTMAIVYI